MRDIRLRTPPGHQVRLQLPQTRVLHALRVVIDGFSTWWFVCISVCLNERALLGTLSSHHQFASKHVLGQLSNGERTLRTPVDFNSGCDDSAPELVGLTCQGDPRELRNCCANLCICIGWFSRVAMVKFAHQSVCCAYRMSFQLRGHAVMLMTILTSMAVFHAR